jgi:8-oxo-dGTP pyrophosphatase MutT (NUDIX family)
MKRQFFVTQYAAIFDEENRLLLLRDVSDDNKGKWVFPGGHIGDDKDAISALARELMEETSLKLNAAWVFRTAIKKYPDGNWRHIVYYVCQAKGKVRLSKEHDVFEWTDLTKAKKMKFRDREEKQLILDLIERKVKK